MSPAGDKIDDLTAAYAVEVAQHGKHWRKRVVAYDGSTVHEDEKGHASFDVAVRAAEAYVEKEGLSGGVLVFNPPEPELAEET